MRKKDGFTLIELLIAIAILVILFLISITAYGSYDRRNNLTLNALAVKSFIEGAQSDALSRELGMTVGDTNGKVEVVLEKDEQGVLIFREYRQNGTGQRVKIGTENKIYREVRISPRIAITGVAAPIAGGFSAVLSISSPDGVIDPSSKNFIRFESANDWVKINISKLGITSEKSF